MKSSQSEVNEEQQFLKFFTTTDLLRCPNNVVPFLWYLRTTKTINVKVKHKSWTSFNSLVVRRSQ